MVMGVRPVAQLPQLAFRSRDTIRNSRISLRVLSVFQRLGLGELARQEYCWASPAVADGALFLRSRTRLYCIKGSA